MPRFIIDYRDPDTGGLRSAYVDAETHEEAERQLDFIGSGEVIGELIDEGPLSFTQIGTA